MWSGRDEIAKSLSPNLRSWFSAEERWTAFFQFGEEILSQVEEFNYLRVLFTSEGKIEGERWGRHWSVVAKTAELKGKDSANGIERNQMRSLRSS